LAPWCQANVEWYRSALREVPDRQAVVSEARGALACGRARRRSHLPGNAPPGNLPEVSTQDQPLPVGENAPVVPGADGQNAANIVDVLNGNVPNADELSDSWQQDILLSHDLSSGGPSTLAVQLAMDTEDVPSWDMWRQLYKYVDTEAW
jgi:hypothetical protein